MSTTNTLAPRQNQPPKLRGLLEGPDFREQVARALPRHLTADRFIRVAATALMRVPKLAECDQVSFFNCLLTLSQLGLEPDGRNAHMIPFVNSKRGVTECQLIIDYKGLVDLAMRSGNVANIHADKVCENDVFEFNLGEITKHVINFRKPRGQAYAYYAVVRFKDSTQKCEVMTKEDIENIRKRSRAGQSGPWVTDYDEMAKKTAFRRLSKWIQLSPEFRDALEHDGDKIEDRRIDSAKPVFSVSMPAEPKPEDKRPPQEEVAEPQEQEDAQPSDDFQLTEGKPTSQEIIRTNLADQGIEEIEFLKWLGKKGKIKLASVMELKPDHADEILEAWEAITADLEAAR